MDSVAECNGVNDDLMNDFDECMDGRTVVSTEAVVLAPKVNYTTAIAT